MNYRLTDLLEHALRNPPAITWLGERDRKSVQLRSDVTLNGQSYKVARSGEEPTLLTLLPNETREVLRKGAGLVVAGGMADRGVVESRRGNVSAWRPWTDSAKEGSDPATDKWSNCFLLVRTITQVNVIPGLSREENNALWNGPFYLPYFHLKHFNTCLETDYGTTVFFANLLIVE